MDLSKSSRSNSTSDAPAPARNAPAGGTRQSYHTQLTEQIASLEISSNGDGRARLSLRQEDLRAVGELGQGNGGTVAKVMHIPTKTLMAKKVFKHFRSFIRIDT